MRMVRAGNSLSGGILRIPKNCQINKQIIKKGGDYMKTWIKNLYASLAALFFTVAVFAGQAQAAIDLPETIDISTFETWAALLIGMLVVMFGYRKIVKSTNRS
jgi:hypothetical protein